MTDQAQRTAWALQQFESFVGNWAPPVMQAQAAPNDLSNEVEHVVRAIRSIAPPQTHPLVGYAVFGQLPDRKRDSGFEHIAISATFDELGQAQNAYEHAKSKGVVAGCDYFVICAVQQVST